MQLEPNLAPNSDLSSPTPGRPRRLWLAIGLIALVVLLAGGAYVAGRLFAQRAQQGGPIGLQGGGAWNAAPGLSVGGAGPGERTIEINLQPAPELPTTPPETRGIFVRRQDNSLVVGTGAITFAVSAGANGEPGEASSSYDGPEIEVVVTSQTEVYRDTTMGSGGPPPEDGNIQQKVEPGDIEEIGSDSSITVWGRKSGDRVIADVLVYSSPTIMIAPSR